MTSLFSMSATILAVLAVPCILASQTLVKLDKEESNNPCGSVYMLKPKDEVRVVSTGLVPNGYCGVTVFTPRAVDNYTCDSLCVTIKTSSMSTCDVKVKMIGHRFGKSEDYLKEFTCHKRDRDSFCWDVSSLRVEVIESHVYAYEEQRRLYEFDLDVSAKCTKDFVPRSGYNRRNSEEDEHNVYVSGIAVGVSLACVFLVILFVAWCYTKHQAVERGPAADPGTTAKTQRPKKGNNILTTFRAKLNIRRKTNQTEGEPSATYRKTEGAEGTSKIADPEAATSELSPLTVETKDTDGDTFELANEHPIADKEEMSKDGGQDSPKDGGMEDAKLLPPKVVIVPGTPGPSDEDLASKAANGDSACQEA